MEVSNGMIRYSVYYFVKCPEKILDKIKDEIDNIEGHKESGISGCSHYIVHETFDASKVSQLQNELRDKVTEIINKHIRS